MSSATHVQQSGQDNIPVGVAWISDRDEFTPEERDQIISWYERYHGDGDMNLAPFVTFWLDNGPGEFRRFKRWVESGHGTPGVLSGSARQLILMFNYAVIGYAKGCLYELIGARMMGASKEQVLEALSFAWLQSGPPGMTPTADLCGPYLATWTTEDEVRPDIFPADWPDMSGSLSSGIDHTTRGLIEAEGESLRDWYRTNLGEVPRYVDFLIEHRPDGLKAYRGRYEYSSRGALPVQMFALFTFFTAAYHGQGATVRRAARHALHLGVTPEQLISLADLSMVYNVERGMDVVVEALDGVLSEKR